MFTFPNSYFRLTHPPNNKSTLPIHFMYHVSGITQPPTSLINQICPTTISSKHYVPSRFMLMLFSFASFKRLLHYASLQNLVLCNTQPHNSLQPFYFFYHNNKLSFSFLSIMNQKEALAIFLTNSAAFPKKVKLPFIERFIFLPKVVIRHSI